MCGNFGLLYLHNKNNNDNNHDNNNQASVDDDLMMNSSYNGNDLSQHVTKEVIVAQIFEGINNNNNNNYNNSKTIILKEPLLILQHQAANTEIRGGQAGGYSSFEYTKCHNSILGQRNIIASISQHSVHSLHEFCPDNSNRPVINCNSNQSNRYHSNNNDVIIDVDDDYDNNNNKATKYEAEYNQIPDITRIRAVARKRVPLAGDLTAKYLQTRKGRRMAFDKTFTGKVQHRLLSMTFITHYLPVTNTSIASIILKIHSYIHYIYIHCITFIVIGHTRFATSSINVVSELHPHEWIPARNEVIWKYNPSLGRFERSILNTCIHITHNGDFDALEAYSQTMVNEEIGYWLEKILHQPNDLKGDSPKIAGCMELFRVQGRWGAAARLAWVRCSFRSIDIEATMMVVGIYLFRDSFNIYLLLYHDMYIQLFTTTSFLLLYLLLIGAMYSILMQ